MHDLGSRTPDDCRAFLFKKMKIMKAEIVFLTPEVAENLLLNNKGNRDFKKNSYYSYVDQMKSGLWKENGEPIIIDVNGIIKDGQHRLKAVIKANYSYYCPVISEVHPDIMDTIDTGSNRSLKDVLKLNGFTYSDRMSPIIKGIMKYERGLTLTDGSADRRAVTNQIGLDYARKNEENLTRLCREVNRIWRIQPVKILNHKSIGVYLYIIAKGLDFNSNHLEFIEMICGAKADSNSCTKYVYDKLISATTNKLSLKPMYKTNLIIKSYNIFNSSDMPIKRLNVKLDEYEKVL